MAFTVQQSVVIDRPRKEVWDYVVDHDAWRRPQVVEVRQITDGEPGPGTRYEDRVKMMGQTSTIVNEIVRWEPPSHMSWTQVGDEGGPRTLEGSYTLDSVDGQTRFALSGTYEVTGLMGLLTPLLRSYVKNKLFGNFVRQLKEILEREA